MEITPIFACLMFLSLLWVSRCRRVELIARDHGYKLNTNLLVPQQVHIAFGSKPNDIVVMWATRYQDSSIVQYQRGNSSDTRTVSGESIMLDEHGLTATPFIHRVYMRDLDVGEVYHYRAMGEDIATATQQYSFRIPKPKLDQPWSFMVYGFSDIITKDTDFTMYEALAKKYQFICYLGDTAYDLDYNNDLKGMSLKSDIQTRGDKLLSKIQTAAAQMPFLITSGDYGRFTDFTSFRYRFSFPTLNWPLGNRTWYSVNTGIVHLVIYSTDVFFHDTHSTEAQLKWLDEDLSAANEKRRSQHWIIAMGHRAMYCSTEPDYEDCRKTDSIVRYRLEELFYRHGVDLIITGHEQFYERTYPVYKGKLLSSNYVDPKGPVHVNVGSFRDKNRTIFKSELSSEWSAQVLSDSKRQIFGKLTVMDPYRIIWEAFSARESSIVDKMWITQRTHGTFVRKTVFIPEPINAREYIDLKKENSQKTAALFESFINYKLYLLAFLCTFLFAVCHRKLNRPIRNCLK